MELFRRYENPLVSRLHAGGTAIEIFGKLNVNFIWKLLDFSNLQVKMPLQAWPANN